MASFYYDITGETLANKNLRESETAYRHALRAARSGAFKWDIASNKIVWSREMGELLKVEPPDYPTTLEEFLQFVTVDERDNFAADIKRHLASESDDYEFENPLLRSDKSIQWVRSIGTIERDESGEPLRLIGLVSDISELHRARDAIKFNEARLRWILDNILALVGTLSLDGILTEVNETAIRMTQLKRDDFIGKAFWECYWWSHSSDVQQQLKQAVKTAVAGEVVRYDVAIRISDEQLITIDLQIAPVTSGSGHVTELVVSGIDITERTRGEERIRDLMREVNHRSKNLLMVVLAIARQTARDGDLSNFVPRLSERITGLSASQDLLINSDWTGANVAELVQSQLAHFQHLYGKRILLEGSPMRLSPVATQAIGMALHELGTNASKYGALSNNRGKVHISWRKEIETEPTFSITWQESGGPPVHQPTRTGFGQKVIGFMAEGAVFGKVQIEYQKMGLKWTLSAPTRTTLDASEFSPELKDGDS